MKDTIFILHGLVKGNRKEFASRVNIGCATSQTGRNYLRQGNPRLMAAYG